MRITNWLSIYNINALIHVIKQNIASIVTIISVFILLQFISHIALLNNYASYVKAQMNYNIAEYNEIDREQLCNIGECKNIETFDGLMYVKNKKTRILKSSHKKKVFDTLVKYEISDDIFISITNDIYIKHIPSQSIYKLDLYLIENTSLNLFFIVSGIMTLVLIVFLTNLIKKERNTTIRSIAGNEAILANKSMILITENIHHELNTPLEVIDNKLLKIYKNIKEYNKLYTSNVIDPVKLAKIQKRFLNIDTDFDYVQQSYGQIYGVLERMHGFKNIRYSNGNKTLYDIVEGSLRVVSITSSNFTHKIDEALLKYQLNSAIFKNADLLNIIINHIKNSIEANSTKIYIVFIKFAKNKVHFRLIDNGNGIKIQNKKSIFDPNFSTKKDVTNSGVRGNGLYLNQSILSSCGGNIELIDTNEYGTTFELTVPAKLKKEKTPTN